MPAVGRATVSEEAATRLNVRAVAGADKDTVVMQVGAMQEAETSTVSAVARYAALGLICLMAFSIRLFAVVRWESVRAGGRGRRGGGAARRGAGRHVWARGARRRRGSRGRTGRAQVIHEFDPYFNYRTTKFLATEGFYDFLNWFDDRAWYPLGRVVGGTIYPGLMATAAAIHAVLNGLNVSIDVRNMCVFLAPVFAANTALATYLLVVEVTRKYSAGLVSAALVAIVPSYISRSVGGSYDNEGVAIFALIFTFYLWCKAVNTGSVAWSTGAALAYFYMVAAWGGYVFIINVIPIYVVIMIFAGRFSSRLYVAYSIFYTLGSLLAMQVPFVGFNVIQQAECAASHGVFVVVQLYALTEFVRSRVGNQRLNRLIWGGAFLAAVAVVALLLGLQLAGKTQWTGRSLSLLDPTYAKKYIPIIASVSEHQPTAWTSFFFDLHICVPFAPVGLYFLFSQPGRNDGRIFLILYGTISWYFAGVMVRLMLTLAPAACMLAGVGISGLLTTFSSLIRGVDLDSDAAPAAAAPPSSAPAASTAPRSTARFPSLVGLSVVVGTTLLLLFYSFHATYVSSEAYSSPSIVLGSKMADGTRVIYDDFREAYYWMRQNTHHSAKIMSWWDYGYQMSSMANRTVLVDNNTWNNTHIATVGRAMSSREEDAYPIMQSLDVDYVLAIFGGFSGYQSDDINKFLWMVRIGGGVFPHIKEPDYFADGAYRMDKGGSPTMLNCMMYKMCYYRFDEVQTHPSLPVGYDRARQVEVGHKNIHLEHLEEVFTSEHWIVRIFKVKKPRVTDPTPAAPSRVALARIREREPGAPKFGLSEQDDKAPKPRFVGCFSSERAFSADREYRGQTAGAYLSLATQAAQTLGKKYMAVARVGQDGHMFAFNTLSGRPSGPENDGCRRGCIDDESYPCGCADNACDGPIPPGEDNNRRWAVYEVPPGAPRRPAASGARSRPPAPPR
jgi:dolichyl-diphosphooligosaccharide--protein glycosyltransferase